MWLNKRGHSSTGSVVVYHGPTSWTRGGEYGEQTFLELSDCRGKVTLHRAESDSMQDFIVKMEKLRGVLNGFIVALKELP
jgi:hypothetical protein